MWCAHEDCSERWGLQDALIESSQGTMARRVRLGQEGVRRANRSSWLTDAPRKPLTGWRLRCEGCGVKTDYVWAVDKQIIPETVPTFLTSSLLPHFAAGLVLDRFTLPHTSWNSSGVFQQPLRVPRMTRGRPAPMISTWARGAPSSPLPPSLVLLDLLWRSHFRRPSFMMLWAFGLALLLAVAPQAAVIKGEPRWFAFYSLQTERLDMRV